MGLGRSQGSAVALASFSSIQQLEPDQFQKPKGASEATAPPFVCQQCLKRARVFKHALHAKMGLKYSKYFLFESIDGSNFGQKKKPIYGRDLAPLWTPLASSAIYISQDLFCLQLRI